MTADSRRKIKELGRYPKIYGQNRTVVARIAGEPGDFTVTFKKPGEKIEFDVPYPLPDEMKVDESGKELNAEQLHAKYMEYNQGKKDILTVRSGWREIRRRGSGGRMAAVCPGRR
jgi:quinone-modifying oxidoreductase, subunit QmoB